jgi:predicted nucleic acid-binding protein
VAVNVYLDASILVSFFTSDALSAQADRFLGSGPGAVVASDLAAAEFASAIARRVRTRHLNAGDAYAVFADFDAWTARVAVRAEATPPDIAAATAFLRRLDLTLRAPDAINIAIAQRVGAALATFDTRMAESARVLGAALAPV